MGPCRDAVGVFYSPDNDLWHCNHHVPRFFCFIWHHQGIHLFFLFFKVYFVVWISELLFSAFSMYDSHKKLVNLKNVVLAENHESVNLLVTIYWLLGYILWYINHCTLLDAKSCLYIYIYIYIYIFKKEGELILWTFQKKLFRIIHGIIPIILGILNLQVHLHLNWN